MLKFPDDMSKARVLIVNDDGIHAEGIKVLEEIVKEITPHVWVVSPETQHSAAGHSFTLHTPLRMKEYDERHFSVSGTPTDATLLGVQKVMGNVRPDIVLSGVNHGQNTADDVTYSGTISAAMEAVIMEIPAIAFSQALGDESTHKQPIDWSIARKFVPIILKGLEGKEIDDKVVLSVNFPVKEIDGGADVKSIPHGHFLMKDSSMIDRVDPMGRPYFWVGPPPKRDQEDERFDVGALSHGHVTLTPLGLNLTHYPTLEKLGDIFND